MYTPKLVFSLLFLALISQNLTAQDTIKPTYRPGFQLSLRAGYDFPFYQNQTPYIDYKGGLELGASADYYWKWFGIGADFDYMRNRPKSTYPTDLPLIFAGNVIDRFNLTEVGITRMFYGLGPSFRYEPSRKFTAELKLRGGLASIKGGRTYLEGIDPLSGSPLPLNFHEGYHDKTVWSGKAQLQFNYWFNDIIGVHAGGYYLMHFDAKDLLDINPSSLTWNSTAFHEPFVNMGSANVITNTPVIRTAPLEHGIQSIGAFGGVTIRLASDKREKKGTYDVSSLTVTARDKFTKQLLPNTDVAVKNIAGEVVRTGTTNNFGVVTFNNIAPDNYTIEGVLFEIALDAGTAMKSEFRPGTTLQKEILYTDANFILKGKAVMCNSATPLQDVSVILKNTNQADVRTTATDDKGEFIFHIKQRANYLLYGKKESFFSQTETISTSDFDRNTTLFVKLEICMEETDCENAITLKNIHYDLGEYFLRAEAKTELNRLVQFMFDNPTIRVELRSHTDSRGSNSSNATLSQNRANAAVDYVVSQGISRDRLVGTGYGETKLLNECADGVNCSESKHQLNRRTEIKIICSAKR